MLFAPHTPNSELKKILQEVDSKVMGNSSYGRVKVVEKLGNSLINSLGNQAPWRREHCQRTGCWPCQTKEGACIRHNIVYLITCLDCKVKGETRVYWGESHRAAWDRSSDHLQAIKVKDEKYAVVKHWLNDHPGETPPKYQFEVKKTFRSSLERQIFESVMIDQQDRSQILNSRSEWGSNRIPRLMVDPETTGQGQGDSSRQGPEEVKEQSNRGQEPGQDQCQGQGGKRKVKVTPPERVPDSSRKRSKLSMLDHFGTV